MYQREQEAVIERAPTTAEEYEVGNSRLGFNIILIMAAFVGLWGTACIISALATLDSLKAILPTLLKAFTGV